MRWREFLAASAAAARAINVLIEAPAAKTG
jgi:hypothetical protein